MSSQSLGRASAAMQTTISTRLPLSVFKLDELMLGLGYEEIKVEGYSRLGVSDTQDQQVL